MKNAAPATPLVDEATAPPQPSTDQPSPGPLGEDTAYCRSILRNLLSIANGIAEILAEEIQIHHENPEPGPGRTQVQMDAAAYTDVARAVRRTIMLYEKLGQPARPRRDRVAARRKIIRDVEDAIEATAPAGEQEALHAELMERLDRPDMEEDIAERPIADIVTDINRDLGISGLDDAHPWKRRIPHDIAILNARAEQISGAGPSEKLLELLASAPPRPPRRGPRIDYRLAPLDISKMSDEDIEKRLKILARYQEAPSG
jgi:hypothetical protein